jgi:hypothetical protein
MRIEDGFTDLVLTSHAGLPAFAQLLKAAWLRAAFGPWLKTIPDADIVTTATALLALGKCDFEVVSAYCDDDAPALRDCRGATCSLTGACSTSGC